MAGWRTCNFIWSVNGDRREESVPPSPLLSVARNCNRHNDRLDDKFEKNICISHFGGASDFKFRKAAIVKDGLIVKMTRSEMSIQESFRSA
jgi:hypothetical protein